MLRRGHRLQRQCEAMVDDLDIPDPFDLSAFLDRLSQRRGRPIVLYPLPAGFPDLPSGLWIPDEEAGVDGLYVNEAYTDWAKEVSVLHECAHMIFRHRQVEGAHDYSWLQRVFTHLTPEMVKMVLCRELYTDEVESEAEMLASVIASRITRRAGSVAAQLQPVAPERAELLNRLATALGS